MCKHGTETLLEVTIPAHLSRTGEERRKTVGIDSCIADLVRALNASGVPTIASCCGHSHRPGSIILGDGRWLHISPDREAAEKIEALFPLNIHGELIE